MAKLSIKALGLSLGILWAVSTFIMGLLAMIFGYGREFVQALGKFYLGYKATFLGSIIGAVWGFIDAGIVGIIIAWLYNKFSK